MLPFLFLSAGSYAGERPSDVEGLSEALRLESEMESEDFSASVVEAAAPAQGGWLNCADRYLREAERVKSSYIKVDAAALFGGSMAIVAGAGSLIAVIPPAAIGGLAVVGAGAGVIRAFGGLRIRKLYRSSALIRELSEARPGLFVGKVFEKLIQDPKVKKGIQLQDLYAVVAAEEQSEQAFCQRGAYWKPSQITRWLKEQFSY